MSATKRPSNKTGDGGPSYRMAAWSSGWPKTCRAEAGNTLDCAHGEARTENHITTGWLMADGSGGKPELWTADGSAFGQALIGREDLQATASQSRLGCSWRLPEDRDLSPGSGSSSN